LRYVGGVFLLEQSRRAVLPEPIFIRQSVMNMMNKKSGVDYSTPLFLVLAAVF